MKTYEYDVVIIGSGAAGLFAAYNISKRKDFLGRILIVTKAPFGESNSRYAQGGIAAVMGDNKKDSVNLHISDTLKSGAGLCDENVVKYITKNAPAAIQDLISIKAGFDCDEFGHFKYNLGGAHSSKRVLHNSDATGMIMIKALCEEIKQSDKIDILGKTMAVELVISEAKECSGVIVFNKNKKAHEIISSNNIILATGGSGQIYKYTTNPYSATADGIALAYNAGAEIQDIEFIQFHPTALVLHSDTKNRYLISEALRGEGAKLINNEGEEFMSSYSEHKELAPRDIVARAIFSEMKKENKPNVFLSTGGINDDIILKNFPSIAKKCATAGIDIFKDNIPIAPAAHYMIGGIKSKINGQTSIKGLYAVGEVASTGFHGANRLASNSLLECVVCAKKLAEEIKINPKKDGINMPKIIHKYLNILKNDSNDYKILKDKLKDIMWEKVGIIRNQESLTDAIKKINSLKQNIEETECFSTYEGYEFKNMLTISMLIAKCALSRKESRGAHYRSDYPQCDINPMHSFVNKKTTIVKE